MNSVRWLKIFLCAVLPLAAQFTFAAEARLEVVTLHSRALRGNVLGDPDTRPVPIFLPAQATNGARLPIVYYLIQKHSTPNIQPSTSDGLNLAAFSVGG